MCDYRNQKPAIPNHTEGYHFASEVVSYTKTRNSLQSVSDREFSNLGQAKIFMSPSTDWMGIICFLEDDFFNLVISDITQQFLSLIFCVYMCVCVPAESRRPCHIPWKWNYSWIVAFILNARNGTWVLFKSTKSS